MGSPDGKRISNDLTVKALAKVAVVAFLFLTVCAAPPAYVITGKSEAATASEYSEESLISSGFKPLRALPSEPYYISDRVKLLHGSSYFILSNLNNFTYKPFHGKSMWIGEFMIANGGSRLEVVFNIGMDNVIAVAGYRAIAESPQPSYVPPSAPPPPVYAPAPQQVYVQTLQPPVVYEPLPIYPRIGIYAFPVFDVVVPLFPVLHNHPYWRYQWGHRPHWGGHWRR
jgi:hypothetical protein